MVITKDQYQRPENVSVAVGLSGGVDSSVAAALLKQQGYSVIGVHMRRWESGMPGCTGDQDRQDALKVAKHLGIPFKVVDFRDVYHEKVIKRFLAEFQAGRIPNPDIWCNEEMKFGVFLEYCLNKLGVDKVATGHYARLRQGYDGQARFDLLAGLDPKKDQSYFLYRLNQNQLAHALFPLGEYQKEEVRQIAHDLGLPTANKKDSVGICFIGDINMQEFLEEFLEVEPGEVVDSNGDVIGQHKGVQLYTIGQRHGFDITSYQGEALYVIGKNVEKNQLVVGRDTVSDVASFVLSEWFWTGEVRRDDVVSNLSVRIRHLGELYVCTLSKLEDRIFCHLDQPIRGVAPGQHAVFYKEGVVFGGGVIDQTFDK